MLTKEIRSRFLNFFKHNGHEIIKSAPLVPHNDPTLLFTNAGMVQFKDFFTGVEVPPYNRAVSSQKCVRAGGKHNDLENVGYTARHHTFFEMLGNFSFGNYFKETAIELAWQFLTIELGIKAEKLYVTVYHDDDEAFDLWRKISGLSSEKIIRIASQDNFWSMGEVGPCGPCSEIFYDHGEKYWGGLPGTPEEDGDRFVEIWNLVFMQYEQLASGERIALPKASIDTGMGLERITAVMQGTNHNYETDIFRHLITESKRISKCDGDITSHRVVADHLRAASFLIADGVMPANDGRGYVLRRILRRAIRHIQQMGCKDILLPQLVPCLVSEMGEAYPELVRAEAAIKSVLQNEEERFRQTLARGLHILEEDINLLKRKQETKLNGEKAFKLYDTYGFPLDLTKDILRAHQIEVDEAGFEHAMQEQKNKARAAWAGSGEQIVEQIWHSLQQEHGNTEFLGYQVLNSEAKVIALVKNNELVKSANKGEKVIVILNQTPFYAEAGGQVGDAGMLGNNKVIDTKKYVGGIHAHVTELVTAINVGDNIIAKVDSKRRAEIAANHSATHLLHYALRQVLGDHVTQKGSIVTNEKLRFDFSHPQAVSQHEIEKIENLINEMILANSPVNLNIMPPEKAITAGAMALFGEKYGDEVRVISMNNSLELCGGTHVKATGEIGICKIISEEAIAAGVRRVEAITGIAALKFCQRQDNSLRNIANTLKTTIDNIPERIAALHAERKGLELAIEQKNLQLALQKSQLKNGVIDITLDNIHAKELKAIAEKLEAHYDADLVVITATYQDKTSILVKVANKAEDKYDASQELAKRAEKIGAKGGGNKRLAQAGGGKL
jgi:alanyl-tRNA synthetase